MANPFAFASKKAVGPNRTGAEKPSLWSIVDGVLGGQTVTEARDDGMTRIAALEESKRRAELIQDLPEYAQRLGLPPEQQLMARLSPQKLVETLAKASEPYTLKPGDVRGMNGETVAAAPDFKVMGEQLVKTQAQPAVEQIEGFEPAKSVDALGRQVARKAAEPVDEVEEVFRRDPTTAENTAHQKLLADIERQMEELKVKRAQLDINRGQLGVAEGRLGVARQAEGRQLSKATGSKPWERKW